MTTVDEPAEVQPFSPLIGQIFTQMFKDSHFTHNAVIEGLQNALDDRDAELSAIRQGVSMLLSGPYMPNPDAIRRAVFYPDKELIDEYKANKEVGW